MNRRTVIGAAVAAAFAVTLAGCKKEEPAAQKTDAPRAIESAAVRIGSASPLTGPQAHIGIDIRNGVQLAIEDANAAGVEIGGRKVKLELVAEDDEANPTKATTVAQKLVDSKVVAVVGHFNSGASIPASKIYSDAGVPQISPANTSDQFTTYNDNGLYFRTAPPDTLQARALADLIIEDGNNTVGILALNDPYGTGLAENTLNNLVDAGLSEDDIVSITYDPQAANFDSEVQEMVDFNPDAIVVIGFEESSRILDGLNAKGVGPQR